MYLVKNWSKLSEIEKYKMLLINLCDKDFIKEIWAFLDDEQKIFVLDGCPNFIDTYSKKG